MPGFEFDPYEAEFGFDYHKAEFGLTDSQLDSDLLQAIREAGVRRFVAASGAREAIAWALTRQFDDRLKAHTDDDPEIDTELYDLATYDWPDLSLDKIKQSSASAIVYKAVLTFAHPAATAAAGPKPVEIARLDATKTYRMERFKQRHANLAARILNQRRPYENQGGPWSVMEAKFAVDLDPRRGHKSSSDKK